MDDWATILMLLLIIFQLGMIGNKIDKSLDKLEGYLEQIVQILKQ